MDTKTRIQQLPVSSRWGHDAILNSNYLADSVNSVEGWGCRRVVLVHSKALDSSTDVISKFRKVLGSLIVGVKSGVGAHSPYADVLEITRMLRDTGADCLISIGSSSYSDACKIARLMDTNLPPGKLTPDDMEALVDPEKGITKELKDSRVRLILVPTSLSASEWSHIGSATNPITHKKQHFGNENAAPDLILLDPNVASTAPRKLWLSSGMRAVDHCVETMCNEQCTEEASKHMEEALATLLQGLAEYKEGENDQNRMELLEGIGQCQLGSRQAMMGILLWRIPMGASHAIGHQLGSACGVMHGVTSCIMLGPVLRYMRNRKGKQVEALKKVVHIFNQALGWEEKTAADTVEKFVRMLGLPNSLTAVGVIEKKTLEDIAEKTMTDVWGGSKRQLDTKEEVMEILETARG